jgi:6,7-dimethyl-8-ribityllumazine synthase
MKEISATLDAKGLRIGIVVSRFNDFLTRQLKDGAIDCIVRHGGSDDAITLVWVPGANELPMAIEKLADRGSCDAIIALGAVVQGATPHATLINTQVSRALAAVASEKGLPVLNGVVCTDTLEQAIERSGTKAGNKGWNTALAAIEMANLYRLISD